MHSLTDEYSRPLLCYIGAFLLVLTTDTFLLISAAILPCAKSNGYVAAVVSKAVKVAAPKDDSKWVLD